MKPLILLCLIMVFWHFPLFPQEYRLDLEPGAMDSSSAANWVVFKVDPPEPPKVIGAVPHFIQGFGYIHSPMMNRDRIFFGGLSEMHLKNGKPLLQILFRAYEIRNDSVIELDSVFERIAAKYVDCRLVIDGNSATLTNRNADRLQTAVRLDLGQYHVGDFRLALRTFQRLFRQNSKLKDTFRTNYLDQI